MGRTVTIEPLAPMVPGLRSHEYSYTQLIGQFGSNAFFYLTNFESDPCTQVDVVDRTTGQRVRITFGEPA